MITHPPSACRCRTLPSCLQEGSSARPLRAEQLGKVHHHRIAERAVAGVRAALATQALILLINRAVADLAAHVKSAHITDGRRTNLARN